MCERLSKDMPEIACPCRANVSELRRLNDSPHHPHTWDFGSGETFMCDGWLDEG